MERALRDHVYAAVYGRDLVLLDSHAGEYTLLAGLGEGLATDRSHRKLCSDDPTLMEAIANTGVLDLNQRAGSIEVTAARVPDLPVRTVAPALNDVDWGEFGWLVIAWCRIAPHYYGRTLPHLVAQVRRGSRRCYRDENRAADIHRVASTFDRLSPWFPLQGACVFRCFFLLRLLQMRGYEGVRWVFGVRTWPFFAHCWLQHGDVALTDSADELAGFSPIFSA